MAITDPVAQVTAGGVTAPTYDEVLEYLQEGARGIFGEDINLDADTQDGQLLAIFAKAISDTNSAIIDAYNAYNPATAQGAALDQAVKTNGLSRHDATKSTVDLTLVGQAGTVVEGAQASDNSGNVWNIPSCSIPVSGEITVTAEADQAGTISAPVGSITSISTPIVGLQSVTNRVEAVVGEPYERDSELRYRQTISTMSPGNAIWDSLLGAIQQLEGVQSVAGQHNDTGAVSDAGIPAHSIAVVVSGGNVQDIAEEIYKRKSQGVATFGAVSQIIYDDYGNEYSIKFSRPESVTIKAAINVESSESWLSTEIDDIKSRLIAYIETLKVGQDVNIGRCVAAVIKHDDGEYDQDFTVTGITLNGASKSVKIAWNQRAACSAADITVSVK